MPDFQILEVTIGLVLVYLVLSLAGTAVNESLTNVFSWRARGLRTGIENLLQDPDLTRRFYAHPLTRSLYERRGFLGRGRRSWPSYLSSRQFTQVLFDLVGADAEDGRDVDLPEDHGLRTVLEILERGAKKKGRDLEAEVEAWFDAGMERVSSWFKGRMQWISVLVGLAIAGIANADTIRLATDLATDPALREAAVRRADELTAASPQPATNADVERAVDESVREIERLGFTLGWRGDVPSGGWDWLGKILGLAITGFAISLGAPFWFDTLKRLTSVRSSKKPDETKEPA